MSERDEFACMCLLWQTAAWSVQCMCVSVCLCDRSAPNPNAANINIVADLYAEVIGVLAQSRYYPPLIIFVSCLSVVPVFTILQNIMKWWIVRNRQNDRYTVSHLCQFVSVCLSASLTQCTVTQVHESVSDLNPESESESHKDEDSASLLLSHFKSLSLQKYYVMDFIKSMNLCNEL